MNVVIREAQMKDYEGICRIYTELDEFHRSNLPELFVQSDTRGRSKEFLSQFIRNENKILYVAVTENEVVGLAECCIAESSHFPVNKPRKWVQIDSLAVRADFRSCNIGFTLLEKVKEWAKLKNLNRIELKVYSFNEKAIGFYNRKGFTELSKTMFMNL